jgi:HD-like signal output (HDOD) protein
MQPSKERVPFSLTKNVDIPSIPLVLIRIIQTLDADTSSAKELEELILHDPALSARILRLANSAFYSFHSTVKTISHAITLLGINLVTSLAIGVNLFDSFTKGAKSEAKLINRLWTHSCAVAVLVRELWLRHSRKEGEFAFLCGLLHDLGKVVLFKTYPGEYSSVFSAPKAEKGRPISSYEEEYYGADHSMIGEMLAKQWGLPAELATIIRRHHDPLATAIPMVNAVMLSDLIAKELQIGYDGDDGLSETELQSKLKQNGTEYERLKEFASRERKSIEEFFQLSS